MEQNERNQIIDAYDRIEYGTPEYPLGMGNGNRWIVTKDNSGNIICVNRNTNEKVIITVNEARRSGGRRRRRRTRRSRGSKKRRGTRRRSRRSRRHH